MAALSKSALKKKEEEEKEPINFDDLHETEETEYIKNIEQEEKEGFTPQKCISNPQSRGSGIVGFRRIDDTKENRKETTER